MLGLAFATCDTPLPASAAVIGILFQESRTLQQSKRMTSIDTAPLMPSTDDELLTKVSDEQSLETSDSGTKSESVGAATDKKAAALPSIPKVIVPSSHNPWYVRGGMHVNEVGLAFNIAVPAVFLAITASEESKWPLTQLSITQLFGLVLIAQIVAAVVEGKRTTFCTVVFPVYLTTLLIIP